MRTILRPLILVLLLLAVEQAHAQPDQWVPIPSLPWGEANIFRVEADSSGALYVLVRDATTQAITLWQSRDRAVTWTRIRDSIAAYGYFNVDTRGGVIFNTMSVEYSGTPSTKKLRYDTHRLAPSGTVTWVGREEPRVVFNKRGDVVVLSKYNEDLGPHVNLVTTLSHDNRFRSMTFTRSASFHAGEMRSPALTEQGTTFVILGGSTDNRRSGIYSGTIGDTAWTLATTSTPAAIYATPAGTLLAGYGNTIRHSTDNGVTWQAVDSVQSIDRFSSDAEGTIYAFSVAQGKRRSSDNGLTWEPISASGSRIWSAKNRTIWTLKDLVPHRSTDRGSTWSPVIVGLPTSRVETLAIAADGTVYAIGELSLGLYRLNQKTLDVPPSAVPNRINLR